MYEEFFGVTEKPFGLTPNTALYYGLPPHEEALQVLQTALVAGEGFIKITGEVGTGKTMVLRLFINRLPDEFEPIYIPNPTLDPLELRLAIARELTIDVEKCSNATLIDDINCRLLELSKAGKKAVLVIDEAQSLGDETLEAVRLLGNLETERAKLLQIILFGQPELDERLNDNRFRQLRQRISFSYALRPLNQDETRAYLNYRMRAAGYKGTDLFTPHIARMIYRSSLGIPRLINILAHKCLVLAYGRGVYALTSHIVKEAIADTDSAHRLRFDPLNIFLILAITVMAISAISLLYVV